MHDKFKEWYLTHKKLVDKLFADSEIGPQLIKCGIVQSFTTKLLCNDFDICSDNEFSHTGQVRKPTNSELVNFFQTIYHAGTTKQFFNYARIPAHISTYIYSGFHYLFDIFKKGIYVVIRSRNIQVYLPFSNSVYRNDWGQNLASKGVLALEEKHHFVPKFVPSIYQTMIQKDVNRWYANYCFFRNTVYKNGILRGKDDEGDKSVANFLQLITELCYERNIPDVVFFISPRDFPVLRKDRFHPYNRLYLPEDPPYLGMFPIGPIPIFSQSVTDEYEDQLIPNDDDIVSVLCDNKRRMYSTNWDTKKSVAVFRGSATGCGTTPENNPRLHLYELSKTHSSIMDVRLTGLNEKVKIDADGIPQIIDKQLFPKINKERDSLPPSEQAKYKYIINVQGHVAAFRLTRELSYGSVILKVNTNWKTWYSGELLGWKVGDNSSLGRKLRDSAHYLIIESDLSNLVSTIEWCMENKRNDDICRSIAARSLQFYNTHFNSKKYMLDYMQRALINISKDQQLINVSPKGLILIPFRDDPSHRRQEQLNQLLAYFEMHLDKDKVEYKVIVQADKRKFNRGLLLNDGVLLFDKFDYYIFHDADLIPDQTLLSYYYEYPTSPIHLGYRGQRWSETVIGANKKFIGGVLSINKYDFFLVNGFPNDYWGWGGEDDDLSYRLKINKIDVTQPESGSVTDLEGMNIEEKLAVLKETGQKNITKREQLESSKKNWMHNGIKQIDLTDLVDLIEDSDLSEEFIEIDLGVQVGEGE